MLKSTGKFFDKHFFLLGFREPHSLSTSLFAFRDPENEDTKYGHGVHKMSSTYHSLRAFVDLFVLFI